MKFNVKQLQSALDSAIETSKANHVARAQARQDDYDREAAHFVEKYGQRWLDAIPKIRAAVKAKRPITEEILPLKDRHYHTVAVFNRSMPVADAPWELSSDLRRIQNVLNLVVDQDEVSFNQLKELGIGVSSLRLLWDLARTQPAE